MSWLPKREKIDSEQASEYTPADRPLASIRIGEYRPSPTGRATEGSGYRCAKLPKAGAIVVQVDRAVIDFLRVAGREFLCVVKAQDG